MTDRVHSHHVAIVAVLRVEATGTLALQRVGMKEPEVVAELVCDDLQSVAAVDPRAGTVSSDVTHSPPVAGPNTRKGVYPLGELVQVDTIGCGHLVGLRRD